MATIISPAERPRLWAPARLAAFRYLWFGQSFSLLGDGLSYVAFAWITLELTGSSLALGYVLALQAIPRALLTLVGGSLSDKWSPRRLMAASAFVRAVAMSAVAVAAMTGSLSLVMLCVAAAVFGAVDAFFQPARVTVLPSVVHQDLLPPSNALLLAGARISAVLGPAIGGVVVAASDAGVAFAVDAVCFLLCGLCVLRIRVSHRPAGAVVAAPDGLGSRIRAGLRYAWDDPRIRTIIVVDTAVTFCYAGPFTVGFATLSTGLSGGATALGLLNAALAGGALLGALAGGTVGGNPRVGLLIAGLTGWLAVGMGTLGVIGHTVTAVTTVLLMGFGVGYQGVFGMSWIQRTIDSSVLSRVVSVDMVLGYAVAPLSLVLCGALAEHGTRPLFTAVAAILVVVTVGVLSSRAVREMR